MRSPKSALRRFQNYKRRQRLVASFVHRLAPQADTLVLWGDGYDGSQHQRCTMPAPAKKLLRSLGAVRRVVMVPEYRTTQACSNPLCLSKPHEATLAVYRVDEAPGARSQVGSRYCPKCKRVNGRDASAARNILAAGIARISGPSKRPPEALRCRAGKERVFGGRDAWYCEPQPGVPAPRAAPRATTTTSKKVKRCGSSCRD